MHGVYTSKPETAQVTGTYESSPIVVNPGAGATIKDSGSLPAGAYLIQFRFWASVQASFRLLWRNAADSANIQSEDWPAVAANTKISEVFAANVIIAQGEIFRIVMVDAITGNVQAAFNIARILG